MKNRKYRLIDLYANTRFSLSQTALLDLFERSAEGKDGLELSLFQILSNPNRPELYEHSLRIDASILVRDDEVGVHSQEKVQEEITAFIADLKALIAKYTSLFPKGKPLYIGLEKPNTIVIGIAIKDNT